MEPVVLDIRMLHHSGIGFYLRGLLEGMSELPDAPRFIFYGPQRFRPEVPERLCELYVLRDFPVYSIREQLFFPEMLRHQSLFHAPHYNIPLRFRGRLVVTIHDLNHLVFQKNLPTPLHRFYSRYLYREIAVRAAHIIVNSEKTRAEVIEYLKVEPERITVLHYGISKGFKVCEDAEALAAFREKHKLPRRYLLSVGINKPHKNYGFLIRTLAQLWKGKKLDIPLVIAGTRSHNRAGLDALVADLDVARFVTILNYVPETDVPKLYQGAEMLIFPSLYEGFGIPPLEAMKLGIPVVASNRQPMPDVIGDAALFFDPTSAGEMCDVISRVLWDSSLRAKLIEKGKHNLSRFDWKKNAQKTIEVYHKALRLI